MSFKPITELIPEKTRQKFAVKLRDVFFRALASADIYPVIALKQPYKQAIEKNDAAAVRNVLHKCPRMIRAQFRRVIEEPLDYALSLKSFEAARAMVEFSPALLEKRDWHKRTPLIRVSGEAVMDDKTKAAAMQELLRMGENLEAVNWLGDTALHEAARKAGPQAAEVLLQAGADPNARNNWKRTPLHYAAGEGNIAVMCHLAAHGANLHLTDGDGRDAVTTALAVLKFDAALWLMEKGALPDFDHADVVDAMKDAKAGKDAAFIAAFNEKKDAWDKMRNESETLNAVHDIEHGLPKEIKAIRRLRMKAAPLQP